MNKKLVFGMSILLGLGIYFSYPTIDKALKNYRMEQELKEYGHTKPINILRGLNVNPKLKADVESRIESFNRAIEYKSVNRLERLFFEDCGNIPEADKRAYIENFLSQNPRIKMEYFQQGEEIIAGVSILNNQGGLIRADELHGNSAGNLRFRCSYEL